MSLSRPAAASPSHVSRHSSLRRKTRVVSSVYEPQRHYKDGTRIRPRVHHIQQVRRLELPSRGCASTDFHAACITSTRRIGPSLPKARPMLTLRRHMHSTTCTPHPQIYLLKTFAKSRDPCQSNRANDHIRITFARLRIETCRIRFRMLIIGF